MEKLEDIKVPERIKNYGKKAVKNYLDLLKNIEVPGFITNLGEEAVKSYVEVRAFFKHPLIKREIAYSQAVMLSLANRPMDRHRLFRHLGH